MNFNCMFTDLNLQNKRELQSAQNTLFCLQETYLYLTTGSKLKCHRTDNVMEWLGAELEEKNMKVAISSNM